MTERPLLKPDYVAWRLNIELRTAYDYLTPGGPLYDLRVKGLGRTVRVDPDKFDQFLERGGLTTCA